MSLQATDLARRFAGLAPEKRVIFLERLAERGIDFAVLPLLAAPRGEGSTQFPLSAAQARLWFLAQLGGSAAVYH
ncbi:hypothetical protein, partial [Rhodomicrobium vannielii]